MLRMKRSYRGISLVLILSMLTIVPGVISCKKTEDPIKFPKGTFPDSTFTLTDLNSSFDDFNDNFTMDVQAFQDMDVYELQGNIQLVYSSNRLTTGGKFDLVQGIMSFVFDQTDGGYELGCEMTTDEFLTKLLNKANTAGNDLGSYRLFSPEDGYEYLLLSSENTSGNLDLQFLKNIPVSGSTLPVVSGPYPASLLNTSSDDGYISFNINKDSAYFSSNSGGNFDIYLKKMPAETPLSTWLSGAYSVSAKADSVNSQSEDKCPFVYKKIMVFASNRPGGLGDFDLYYSIFKKGKWSSPVNFGPAVNTSSDEYRPTI
jgi:hypothetical protein